MFKLFFKRSEKYILQHIHLFGALTVLLFSFVLFYIQSVGISETLNNDEYIEAGLALAESLPTAPPSVYPKLVIIIDDFGESREGVNEILAIKENLTISVMPFMTYTINDAEAAHAAKHDVIMHISFYTDKVPLSWLGSRIISPDLSKDEIYSLLNDAYIQIPMAKGINSHIGSMGCDSAYVKDCVQSFASSKNIFPVNNVDFYIDGSENPTVNDVKKQIKLAAAKAKEKGLAIAVGHIGSEGGVRTALAIEEMLPWLAENNVHIVGINEIFE